MTVEADELKRLAATAAVAQVEDGMVLGLGSGSTATLASLALQRLEKFFDGVSHPALRQWATASAPLTC